MHTTSQTSAPTVPREFSGKWIAWDFERTKILASGFTLAETKRAAEAAGESRPILAKVPRADSSFIGGRR